MKISSCLMAFFGVTVCISSVRPANAADLSPAGEKVQFSQTNYKWDDQGNYLATYCTVADDWTTPAKVNLMDSNGLVTSFEQVCVEFQEHYRDPKNVNAGYTLSWEIGLAQLMSKFSGYVLFHNSWVHTKELTFSVEFLDKHTPDARLTYFKLGDVERQCSNIGGIQPRYDAMEGSNAPTAMSTLEQAAAHAFLWESWFDRTLCPQ